MEKTYFGILPCDVLYVTLSKLFNDPVVYYLIDFLGLDSSESFRALCIKAVPMLSRFGKNFTFRYRRLSWMSIYEGLLSQVFSRESRKETDFVFDKNFTFDQEFWKYSFNGMLNVPYVCDDFMILRLYHYDNLSETEECDTLLVCEHNIFRYFRDHSMIDISTSPWRLGSVHNFEIYRDIIYRVVSNYEKRIALYKDEYQIHQDFKKLIKIPNTRFIHDPRTMYTFKLNTLPLIMVGIYDGKEIRKLTKDEVTIAKLLNYTVQK